MICDCLDLDEYTSRKFNSDWHLSGNITDRVNSEIECTSESARHRIRNLAQHNVQLLDFLSGAPTKGYTALVLRIPARCCYLQIPYMPARRRRSKSCQSRRSRIAWQDNTPNACFNQHFPSPVQFSVTPFMGVLSLLLGDSPWGIKSVNHHPQI